MEQEPNLLDRVFPEPPRFQGRMHATRAEWDDFLDGLSPTALAAYVYCAETHFPSRRVAMEVFPQVFSAANPQSVVWFYRVSILL